MTMTTRMITDKSRTAFIIGNGKSREGFNLESLRKFGTIYGCNAIYRDFIPDYLIAIDQKIIDEINNSDFPKDKFIVPKEEEQYENPEYNPFTRWRSNAGMNAIVEALRHGKTNLFLIGFDFIIASEASLSNMYSGTNAYGPETKSNMTDNVNRSKYLNWFVNKYAPNAFYHMVLPRVNNLVIQPINGKNVKGIFIDKLVEYLEEMQSKAA